MKIYKDFSYADRVGYYKFLANYPEKIANYELQPFNSIYRRIEEFADSDYNRGFWVSSPNPINTGSLLIPLAIKLGITYVNILNLTSKDVEETMEIVRNTELIIDEIGSEGQRMTWLVDKIMQERYSNGLITFIGSTRPFRQLNNTYNAATLSKMDSMTCFRVDIETFDMFPSMDSSKNIILTEK